MFHVYILKLLRHAGIGFIVAPVEADPVMVHLCTIDSSQSSKVYPRCLGVITNDSDMISYSGLGGFVVESLSHSYPSLTCHGTFSFAAGRAPAGRAWYLIKLMPYS